MALALIDGRDDVTAQTRIDVINELADLHFDHSSLKRAYELYVRAVSEESTPSVEVLRRLAQMDLAAGQVTQARQWLQRALDDQSGRAAPDDRTMVDLLTEFAMTYLPEGDQQTAELYLDEAKRRIIYFAEPNSIELAELIERHAQSYLNYGYYERAELEFMQVLGIRHVREPDSRETALTRYEIGKLNMRRRDAKGAIGMIGRAIATMVELNTAPDDLSEPRAEDDTDFREAECRRNERQRRAAVRDPILAHMIADYAVANQEGSAPVHTMGRYEHAIETQKAVFGERSVYTARTLVSAGSHISEMGLE